MSKSKQTPPKLMQITVGRCYYLRGPRNDYVGRVVAIETPFSVVLEDAAWVANSGRLSVFLAEGRAPQMEVEPCGDRHVGVRFDDWFEWPFPLFFEAV